MRDENDIITAGQARELFTYDPLSGDLTWNVQLSPVAPVGSICGTITEKGYRYVAFNRRRYAAHRIIWLMMTGEWPPQQMDHRDLDKANNRWSNLRLATRSQNQQNRRSHRDSASAYKGVYYRKERGTWISLIRVDGRLLTLGTFQSEIEAARAYDAAARKHFGAFCCVNFPEGGETCCLYAA